MGAEIVVPATGAVGLGALVDALAADGRACVVLMIDGALWPPGRACPDAWREARLKTPAGMVTLARRGDGVAVVVFGNASEELRATQVAVAEAVKRAGQ
jgi:hypothetical protein